MLIDILLLDPPAYFTVVAILIVSTCLHELAHGMAALSQGDDTPEYEEHMTWNPLVHFGGWMSLGSLLLTGTFRAYMPINPDWFEHPPWSGVLVYAAGCLMNLTLASFCFLLYRRCGMMGLESSAIAAILLTTAQINLMLGLANLVPIPPSDGFRILAELLPPLKALEPPRVYSWFLTGLFVATGCAMRLYHYLKPFHG